MINHHYYYRDEEPHPAAPLWILMLWGLRIGIPIYLAHVAWVHVAAMGLLPSQTVPGFLPSWPQIGAMLSQIRA